MNYPNSRRILAGHNAYEVVLRGANMRGSRANGSSWVKCKFEKVDFDASLLSASSFDRCDFSNCRFQNSSFSACRVVESTFSDCDLIQTDFGSAILKDVKFSTCQMEFSTFFEATANEVCFRDCNLSSAILLFLSQKNIDYSGSNLHNAAFRFGCLFFRDATFDSKQWSMFQSLVGYAKGVESLQRKVMEFVDPRVQELVGKLIDEGHVN